MPGSNGFRKTTWQCMGNACAYARKSEPEYCPCTINTPTDTLFYALNHCLYDRDRPVQWAAVPKTKKTKAKKGAV
jgi:hypothetical protein